MTQRGKEDKCFWHSENMSIDEYVNLLGSDKNKTKQLVTCTVDKKGLCCSARLAWIVMCSS